MNKKKKNNKKLSVFLWIVFLVIFTICSASAWYIWRLVREIQPSKDKDIQGIRKDYKINWSGRINVLLLGCDSRDGMYMGIRSDTIILANIDLKEKIIRVMSIPRDTRVFVPNHDTYDKINSTINPDYFSDGGLPLTLRTAENLLKVPIKLYALMDFTAFEEVVNIVGGVRLHVEKDMYYHDPTDNTLINLKEGDQELDGDKALQYVRFRWDAQGDFARDSQGVVYGRISRQMNFVKALAKKVAENRSILRVNHIVNAIARKFETNMDTSEMLKLGIMFKDLDPETQLKVISFPGYGDYVNGLSYVVVQEEELESIIQQEFLGQPTPSETPPADQEETSEEDQ